MSNMHTTPETPARPLPSPSGQGGMLLIGLICGFLGVYFLIAQPLAQEVAQMRKQMD